MRCELCGGEFRPTNHNGRKQKYCSRSCSNKAAYRKRKLRDAGELPPAVKLEPREKPVGPQLDRRSFERMMDESLEDVLRHNRDCLQAALDDSSTNATALPAISRQLIAVCERLEDMRGGGGLFDSEEEESEVSEDVGASLV